jgi:hypothetical protein
MGNSNLTQTSHNSCKLPRSRKLPFSLRCANHNRHFQFTGSFEDTFQDDEIGDVEVSNRDTVSSCFLKLSIHTAVLAASKSRPSVLDVRHAFLLWSCRRCCVR